MKINFKPKVFNTQREAYWYRKAIEDTRKSIMRELERELDRYNLEYLDHLPIGEKDREDKEYKEINDAFNEIINNKEVSP